MHLSNRSLCLPVFQKISIIAPKLKKRNVDVNVMSNYRPISNLSFLSKNIEENHLLPMVKSAYRSSHSTKPALFRILSDVCDAAYKGSVTAFVLLDLSAAFDRADYDILFRRLEKRIGIQGQARRWINYYLTDRSMQVRYGDN